jgi:hypothetical protein
LPLANCFCVSWSFGRCRCLSVPSKTRSDSGKLGGVFNDGHGGSARGIPNQRDGIRKRQELIRYLVEHGGAYYLPSKVLEREL